MKYRSMENRFCMSLVAFAVIVRLLLATGVSAALDSAVGLAPKLEAPDEPDVFLLEILEPETAPSEPPVQPEIAAASEAPAEQETEAEPVDPPLVFSADEADAIGIVGACSYQPDKQALLTRPSALSLSDDGPAVLIVHTHSSEAYTMEAGFEYQESDALRTLDEQYSVIRVGDEIADILTEAGISVLHDTQPNDYPNYNGAYERMRQTIEGYLAEYSSIQMVLDIHRDAAEDADGNPVALTAEADGEACAELMLVVGTDEGGLSHPDWQENLANALKIQTLLNRSAPGLCRNLNLRTERFNQHETPGSLLVEVGASGNTLAEALRSARILGQALAVFLRGQMHDETVVLLSHKKPDGHINVKVEFGEGEGKVPLDNIAKRAEEYKPKERVTYKMIKEYIEAKYGFKVHTAYIAEVKRDLGLPMYDAPNAVEELKQPRKHPTAEKVEAIRDALKHFEVI